jgi:UDP-N-acetylmuramate--alanine ligase
MDIYGSAREEAGKISSLDLVEEIKKNRDNVRFIENEDQLLEILNEQVKAPAVIITLGAGNIYKVGQKIKELFKID